MKFILRKNIKLGITKAEFDIRFKANVVKEEIHYFMPPLLKNKVTKAYSGIIYNNEFRLKKNTSFNPNLNFETCYGKVIETDEGIELQITIHGIQGFSILMIFIFILVGLITLLNIVFEENYNQNGALYVLVPIFGIFYYLIYKKIIIQIVEDVANTTENLESNIRNWLRT
ncbi:hypothetical protein [uncultured Aquimarina sp.]|uniref:hypothetical protein n=1 Tax=uncultured Aquimarina sp. TaxID=575652 RepID=UPI0026382044|nr:hypothetical protein [uncultured Aquimarina sp.]